MYLIKNRLLPTSLGGTRLAGNMQHHVWQMLQRGFGEKRGRDHHVWVYRKSEPAKRTATRLFGVEKHFYGSEGSEADANITKYESENQSAIQDIRKLPHGAEVDPEFVSVLIAHLEMRSAFLREEVAIKLQKAVGGLVQGLKSPEKLRAMMLAHLKENPEELDKRLVQSFLPQNQRSGFDEIAHEMIARLPDEQILASMGPVFGEMGKIAGQFPDLMKEGQNKAFVENVASETRSKLHVERDYSVCRLETGAFILPDTTLAFVTSKGATPFFQKEDEVEVVILPIASDTAIMGKTKTRGDYPLKAMNRLLAACSYQAFLAKEQNASFQGLAGRIGKYANIISEGALRSLVQK